MRKMRAGNHSRPCQFVPAPFGDDPDYGAVIVVVVEVPGGDAGTTTVEGTG
jgi:hypothetical protein